MLVSKFLNEAFLLAENASRGDFPSISKSTDFLKFNLDDVALILDTKQVSDAMVEGILGSPFPILPYKLNSYHYRYEKYKDKEFNIKFGKMLRKYGSLSFKNNKLDKRNLNKMKKNYENFKANDNFVSADAFDEEIS